MPGGNICEESLEQRIERIRKRDEEIEKRHREAEADRLAALQANAMVKTTAPVDDDDWPKAHKYDSLDFTYDVKCEQFDADEKNSTDEPRLQRPFKKFPDGQGPPSDPKFNFLADAERDGKTAQGANTTNETKNWRANNNNNSNSSSNSNRRNSSNNSSFNRGRSGGGKGVKPQTDGKKGKSNDDPILRKNDRERNNEQRMQRQKSNDGMWRRASDDTKEIKRNVSNSPTNKNAENRQTTMIKADASPTAVGNKTSVQQRMAPSKLDVENVQQKLADLSVEKRGNITVSVTKDGEVKSVKLETARAIGSGRVGGVTMQRHNIQPQQQFVANTQPSVILDPNVGASTMNYPIDMNYPTIDQFIPPAHTHLQQQQQQLPPQQPLQQQQQQPITVPIASMTYNNFPVSVPLPAPAPAPMPTVSVPKPMPNVINGTLFKLPSVQDRLIKNRLYFDENLKNGAQPGSNGVGNK